MINKLPREILDRSTLRGNEYAWAIDDVPQVIKACEAADLVNVGGQLQFRLPDGETCECYWVEIDALKQVEPGLTWSRQVEQSAQIALRDFAELTRSSDFLAEGRKAFQSQFRMLEDAGGDPRDFLCFVWYAAENPKAAMQEASTLVSYANDQGFHRIVLEFEENIGVYVFVYATEASLSPERDYLQDDFEMAMLFCLEDFAVPRASWQNPVD